MAEPNEQHARAVKFRRPPIIKDMDAIRVRLSRPEDARVVHQFACDMNEGTLLWRSAGFFRAAAEDRRLIHATVQRTDHIVAVLSFTPPAPRDAFGSAASRTEEGISGLTHPKIRGVGLMTRMLQAAMIHRLRHRQDHPYREWVAHTLEGNEGAGSSLLRGGFRHEGISEFDPAQFGGAMDHMIRRGGSAVRTHRYRFDPQALDLLVYECWRFIKEQESTTMHRKRIRINILFDSDLLDRDYLDEHVRRIGANDD